MLERPRRIAAIDLGSNSFHMTLAELSSHGCKTYHREKRKVRLAAGLNADNQLDDEAISRALATLSIFGQILAQFQPDDVRAVGTYSFRTARNIQQLTQRALSVLPYPIEILSGNEEARLIFQGVSHDQHLPDKTLVVDIGGGSTELIIGRHTEAKLLHSCDMGCVSLTERYFRDGSITSAAFERALVFCEQQLEHIHQRYQSMGWQLALGSSGTIKALSQCASGLGLSDGSLTSGVLEELRYRFISAGHADQLQQINGLTEDRQPVIVAGLVILTAVFDLLGIDTMGHSDAALREGLLIDVQDRLSQKDIRHLSVDQLASRFACDPRQAQKVSKTALALFDAATPHWQFDQPDYRKFLGWACQLHEIGHHINHLGSHRHAAYLVSHSSMAGFNTEQQALLAFMLLSQRKSLKLNEAPALESYQLQTVWKLILILRLAIRLNQFRQSDTLDSFEVTANERGLVMRFHSIWKKRQALFSSDLLAEQEQFEPLGIHLHYEFSALATH